MPDDAVLSPADIARLAGVDLESLRKRLERLREHDHNAFIENENRTRKQPQYLYKASVVRPIVKDMKKKQASSETSSKRPSRKK
jgi:hypothetical protein